MTIQQKQCLLCYLGYYTGAIDGIWGPLSQDAEEAFRQAEKLPEGDVGQQLRQAVASWQEEDPWAGIRYFAPQEFACKCGCGFPASIDGRLLTAADRVRESLRTACIVSSGLRCKTHNANVGGVSNSRHLTGRAMDFCAVGKTAAQILKVANAQPEVRYAYAIDDRYVHMDVE